MTQHNSEVIMRTGWVSEIFSSIQGEGVYCGVRQLFIRFSRCNLNCSFCDAPLAGVKRESFRVEFPPGSLEFREEKNPVSAVGLMEIVDSFSRFRHHSISLTGGEPLLQGDFLEAFLPLLKKAGHRVYLETNGTLPEKLKAVLPNIDTIAMDIKLPSTAHILEKWMEHEDFLHRAVNHDLFVKIVTGKDSSRAEFEQACRLISTVSQEIPLIIQPLTNPNGAIDGDPGYFINLCDLAGNYLNDIRLIPQTHKMMGELL